MNSRQIECFLEAARELNFTRAAENLRLPQPAVSRYIASLESELDTKLFTRERNRKITLTEAGKAYFNLFQRTETELSLTKTILAEKPEALRLGINLSWSSSAYLPRAILRCEMQNPKFRLSYQCLDFREMTAALREKRLDAIIGLENYLLHSREFEIERITSIERMVVYSKKLPGYENIKTPADFYPYDFLIADDPLIVRLMQESETVFRAFHFVPRLKTLPNQATVHSYVENGLGVALLDEWCNILHRPAILRLSIGEKHPVALAWRKNARPSTAELLCTELHDVFQEPEQQDKSKNM